MISLTGSARIRITVRLTGGEASGPTTNHGTGAQGTVREGERQLDLIADTDSATRRRRRKIFSSMMEEAINWTM